MLAYCSKCRVKRQIKASRVIATFNGRPALQGECPVCGMKMTTFIKNREPVPA